MPIVADGGGRWKILNRKPIFVGYQVKGPSVSVQYEMIVLYSLKHKTSPPTLIERQDSQTPFLEGTHLGIKRVEARTGFDQSD